MAIDSQRVHDVTAQHGESEEKAVDLALTKPVQTGSAVARARTVLKRVTS
jgi:hypothetical protein